MVNDVSLEVETGESIGIVGPNGSVKTTLYNVISGVYPVDQGRIIFEKNDITPPRANPPVEDAACGEADPKLPKSSIPSQKTTVDNHGRFRYQVGYWFR